MLISEIMEVISEFLFRLTLASYDSYLCQQWSGSSLYTKGINAECDVSSFYVLFIILYFIRDYRE